MSTFQAKRQLFHTEIRRQQLDNFRRKKRFELFGIPYDGQGKKVELPNQRLMKRILKQKLKQKILEQKYPFNQDFKSFMVGQMLLQYNQNQNSLQSINALLEKLVTFNLQRLCDTQQYDPQILLSLLRLLIKIFDRIVKIPYKSILRDQQQIQLTGIKQKLYHIMKHILKSVIIEQNFQESSVKSQQKMKKIIQQEYRRQIRANQMNNQMQNRQIDKQQLQRRIQDYEKNIKKQKHPIQYYNQEIKTILQLFFQQLRNNQNIYNGTADEHNNRMQEMGMVNSQDHNTINQLNNQVQKINNLYQKVLLSQEHWIILWYLVSFINYGMFVDDFFKLLSQQLTNIVDFKENIVDFTVETLGNFIINEVTQSQKAKLSKSNQIPSNNGRTHKYSSDQILFTFTQFDNLLNNFHLSNNSILTIVKSLFHLISTRKEAVVSVLLQFSLIDKIVKIIIDEQEELNKLTILFLNSQINQQQFKERLDKMGLLQGEQKFFIYQLLGVIFAVVQDQQNIRIIKQDLLQSIASIVFEQFNILFRNKQIKPQILELPRTQQKQKIVQSLFFMMANLMGIDAEIVRCFIERGIMNPMSLIWGYCQKREQQINTQSQMIQNVNFHGLLADIRVIRSSIINNVYNMLVMLMPLDPSNNNNQMGINRMRNNQQNYNSSQYRIKYQVHQENIDCLRIVIEYNKLTLLKLFINYLKIAIYQTEKYFVNHQSLNLSLRGIQKCLEYIYVEDMRTQMIQDLEDYNFNIHQFKEMLNCIMNKGQVFEEQIINRSIDCHNLLDKILDMNGYDEQIKYREDRRFYEQNYESNYVNNQNGNNTNYNANRNNNNMGHNNNNGYNTNNNQQSYSNGNNQQLSNNNNNTTNQSIFSNQYSLNQSNNSNNNQYNNSSNQGFFNGFNNNNNNIVNNQYQYNSSNMPYQNNNQINNNNYQNNNNNYNQNTNQNQNNGNQDFQV